MIVLTTIVLVEKYKNIKKQAPIIILISSCMGIDLNIRVIIKVRRTSSDQL